MRKQIFFYGWYFKCQTKQQTLAVIPALHYTGRKGTCSIQIITEENAWTIELPMEESGRKGGRIFIGNNRFGKRGILLSVKTTGLEVKGKLDFRGITPLRYDIMGPFSLVPFMECRHSVWSMRHSVSGRVSVNGTTYVFQEAEGYWEGDRGRSFPKEYLWTQSFFPGGSLMLSVADIPLAGMRFQGIIGVVSWQDREYRLATYLGARVTRLGNGLVRVVQGSLALEAALLEKKGKALMAPVMGNMVRTIHESAACRASYRFLSKNHILLAFETDRASFEYEYQK